MMDIQELQKLKETDFSFPKATEELLFVIQKHRENPAPAINDFLQKFGVECAQSFMTSLTRTSGLFSDDELLERDERAAIMITTTENLPALQPARQPVILTKQCQGGWIACLADDPGKWEWGDSESEAIGRLHKMHQDVFGAIQRQEQ